MTVSYVEAQLSFSEIVLDDVSSRRKISVPTVRLRRPDRALPLTKHRISLEIKWRLKHVLVARLSSSFQLQLVYTVHNVQQYSCRQFRGRGEIMEVKVDLKNTVM